MRAHYAKSRPQATEVVHGAPLDAEETEEKEEDKEKDRKEEKEAVEKAEDDVRDVGKDEIS